ncbi:hypothetical protein [Mechercharimyces sp. CAU 1602]|uniref:hypothetical protein n=1 Tax=Mechercharimyces sp. CAU 1602 TaxID=2973933 RepID=UPI002162F0AA|nr:hypothetical protein [Mechercharimyces sp. CAU 1602]MCS1349985.1 hypothetical protein [Mechercharimyces sp. CAU 1602]
MNLIAWTIVACEILFWVFIVSGLLVRYIWKKKKLSFLLLAASPFIDLMLLIITAVDLYNGATATIAHALAAVYIGVSLAFGKRMITWIDERLHYYILRGDQPPQHRFGWEHAKYEFSGWLRHLLAYMIGASLLLLTIAFVKDPTRTEVMSGMLMIWGIILTIDFVISTSYFLFPKKEKRKERETY